MLLLKASSKKTGKYLPHFLVQLDTGPSIIVHIGKCLKLFANAVQIHTLRNMNNTYLFN